ncbi:heavy metal-binding domain-containing protein [uncultured Amphritea sp.]|uniref:YbjQ family protein n=1 Tax=uncultured Amphritea sp. TaxID=981605 RepID=UPI0025F757B3|nr:heavy metal-binding domain-containing protein [uncultured Amphritea sp.]
MMTNLIIFLVLMTLGYLAGQVAERKHYKSIIQREKRFSGLPVIASRFPPTDKLFNQCLVSGNTVISVDYFKRFIAALRNLLGGRVTSYESLLDRARRESLLRMQAQAYAMGAEYVFNVKYETASISKGRKNAIGSVEVLAYGTALIASDSGTGREI